MTPSPRGIAILFRALTACTPTASVVCMRREALWEYIRGALWVLPTIAVVLALGIGLVLSQIEVSSTSWFVFQGTPDDARTLLIAISSTLATVIALVLGLTVVALQLASTQFSPRLLRNFLRDRTNQVVLSVFVATFTYSTAGLFTVGVVGGTTGGGLPAARGELCADRCSSSACSCWCSSCTTWRTPSRSTKS